jgi:hypothetical protein
VPNIRTRFASARRMNLFQRPETRLDNEDFSWVRLSSLTLQSVRLESLTYSNAGASSFGEVFSHVSGR